jgi:hypothetical protein
MKAVLALACSKLGLFKSGTGMGYHNLLILALIPPANQKLAKRILNRCSIN